MARVLFAVGLAQSRPCPGRIELAPGRIELSLGQIELALGSWLVEAFADQPFPGRVVREYAVVPHDLIRHPKELEPWIRRSLELAAAMKPKTKKGPRKEGGAEEELKHARAPAARGFPAGARGHAPTRRTALTAL